MPKRHLFNICLFLLTITIAMAGIACSGSQRDDDISSQISLLGFDKNNPLIIGIDADYARQDIERANENRCKLLVKYDLLDQQLAKETCKP